MFSTSYFNYYYFAATYFPRGSNAGGVSGGAGGASQPLTRRKLFFGLGGF